MSLVNFCRRSLPPGSRLVRLFAVCLTSGGLWPGQGQAGGLYQGFGAQTPAAVGRELWVKFGGKVYAQGNYSRNGTKVDSRGNRPQAFLAAPVDTTDACTAALQVRNTAGVRPLDATDQQYLAPIMLPTAPCAGT
jgi:hypothetical protein